MLFLVLFSSVGAAAAHPVAEVPGNSWTAKLSPAMPVSRNVVRDYRDTTIRSGLQPFRRSAAGYSNRLTRDTGGSSPRSYKLSSLPLPRIPSPDGPSIRWIPHPHGSSTIRVRRLAGVDPSAVTTPYSTVSPAQQSEPFNLKFFTDCGRYFPLQCGIRRELLDRHIRVHLATLWADYVVTSCLFEEAVADRDTRRQNSTRSDLFRLTRSQANFSKCLRCVASACGQIPSPDSEEANSPFVEFCDRTIFLKKIAETVRISVSLLRPSSGEDKCMEPCLQLALTYWMLHRVETRLTSSSNTVRSSSIVKALSRTLRRHLIIHGLDLCITLAWLLLSACCLTRRKMSKEEDMLVEVISRSHHALEGCAERIGLNSETAGRILTSKTIQKWLRKLNGPRLGQAMLLGALKKVLANAERVRNGRLRRGTLAVVLHSYFTLLVCNIENMRNLLLHLDERVLPQLPIREALEAVYDWLERVLESRALRNPIRGHRMRIFIEAVLRFLRHSYFSAASVNSPAEDRIALLTERLRSLRQRLLYRHHLAQRVRRTT